MKRVMRFLSLLLSLALSLGIFLPQGVFAADQTITAAFLGNTVLKNELFTAYPEQISEYLGKRLDKDVSIVKSSTVDFGSADFMNSLVTDVLPANPDMVFLELNISKQYSTTDEDLVARLESMVLTMMEAEKIPAIYFIYFPEESMLDQRAPFDKVARHYEITVLDVFKYLNREYKQGSLRTKDFLTAGLIPSEEGHSHLTRAAVNELEMVKNLLKTPKQDIKPLSGLRYEVLEKESVSAQEEKTDGTILYVAVNGGNDKAKGTIDAPLRTVEEAKRRIRTVKKAQGTEFNGATVYLREGLYRFPDGLTFTEEDSGTDDAGIVYRAYEGETVRFTNATVLKPKDFKPVTDPAVLARMHTNGLGHILQFELDKANLSGGTYIKNTANPETKVNTSKIMYDNITLGNMLSVNGMEQERSRYPNGGWAMIADHQDTANTHVAYEVDAPKRWNTNDGSAFIRTISGSGYFTINTRMSDVDTEKKFINLTTSTTWTMESGWLWSVVNLFEELDVPGEWCVDEKKNVLYYYPREDFNNSEILFSSTTTPVVSMKKCKGITLENIIIENGAGSGVEITDGIRNTVKDCTLKNLGHVGVRITHSGTPGPGQNGVVGCHIYNTATGGVYLKGGDRAELTMQNDYVENCHFENYSTIGHHCTAGVFAAECVGVYIRNCLFHNDDSTAIQMHSNELYIEYNEFCNVVKDSDDTGVIYGQNSGRTEQSPFFNHNYLHDIKWTLEQTQESSGVVGFYADAMANSGCRVENNVFQRVPNSIQMWVSKNQTIAENLFLDSGDDGKLVHLSYDYLTGAAAQKARDFYQKHIDEGTIEDLRGKGSSAVSASGETLFYKSYLGNTSFTPENQKNYFLKYPWMEHYLEGDFYGADDMLVRNNAFFNTNQNIKKTIGFNGFEKDQYNIQNYLSSDPMLEADKPDDPYARIHATMERAAEKLDSFEVWDVKTAGIKNEPRPISDFKLVAPIDGQREVDISDLRLSWDYASGADEYHVQIATDASFKNIIFDKTSVNNFIIADGMETGARRYYWRVAAKAYSNSFTGEPVAVNGPFSFYSARYIAPDKAELGLTLEAAKALALTLVEGTESGQYQTGTIAELENTIAEGERVYNDIRTEQRNVDEMQKKVRSAHILALSKVNLAEIDASVVFSDLENMEMCGAGNKLSPATESSLISVDGDKVTLSEVATAYTKEPLGAHEILHFTGTFDFSGVNSGSVFNIVGIRAQNKTYEPWKTPSYVFSVTKSLIELQAFKPPTQIGKIYTTVPNDYLLEGKEHDIEFGAIPVKNGVRLILRIDGQIIFDYLDQLNFIEQGGYGEIYTNRDTSSLTIAPPKTDLPYPSLAELLADPESELNKK